MTSLIQKVVNKFSFLACSIFYKENSTGETEINKTRWIGSGELPPQQAL